MEAVRVTVEPAVEAAAGAARTSAEAPPTSPRRRRTPAPPGLPARGVPDGAREASPPVPSAVPERSPRPRRPAIERRSGRLLRLLRDRDRFRALGFVRLSDYVVERLGISYRTAQEWMRTDEALERLPLAAAAFEAEEITSGHVRLLTRVARPDSEACWVGLARRSTIRSFTAAVAAGEKASVATAGEHGRPDPGGSGDRSARPGSGAPVSAGAGAEADGRSLRSAGPGLDAAVILDGDEPETARLEISAPAWLAASWRETVAFARRVAGAALPPGECLEMVLAEFAGMGRAENDDAPGGSDGPITADAASPPDADPGCSLPPRSTGRCGAALGASPPDADSGCPLPPPRGADAASHPPAGNDLHPSAPEQWVGVSPDGRRGNPEVPPPASAPGDGEGAAPDLDARAMDRELRGLMAAWQRQEWSLAEHLRGVAMLRWYLGDGFASLDAYARERLGLSPRRAYYLLALQRTLDRLPLLRRAFLDGRVTVKEALLLARASPATQPGLRPGTAKAARKRSSPQATFRQGNTIGSVATVVTEGTWIERASRITLRRLEDEVCFWRHLKEVRPAVWEMLDGRPLPEGIVLVPGREPRLHASAGSPAGGFLRALESEERSVPMPERRVCIRLRVEAEVEGMWDAAVARCRSVISPEIEKWEVLALALSDFWRTWDNQETRRQRRENPTLERDGWICSVPGCRAVGTGRLQDHHVVFRGAGGTDDEWNRSAICAPHHHRGIHDGFIRCSGRAPDDLVWELGVEQGREAFLVFRGDTRVAGAAV